MGGSWKGGPKGDTHSSPLRGVWGGFCWPATHSKDFMQRVVYQLGCEGERILQGRELGEEERAFKQRELQKAKIRRLGMPEGEEESR